MPSGPVTARITGSATDTVDCEAWAPAQRNSPRHCPRCWGRRRRNRFRPDEPTIAAAQRRVPHLRLGRTGRVLEALMPAVLEQRVYGKDARRAWRRLVTRYGEPAPGPAPEHMRVPPSAEAWRRIPSWEFHLANVDPGRARTMVGMRTARGLDGTAGGRPAEQARAALTSLPGVGEWTAAEIAQRAFGDADAMSVGDYHLAKMVGWSLLGHPIDDPAMVELLEPLRPHRHRAMRLLEVSGLAINPRFGARQAIPKHADM